VLIYERSDVSSIYQLTSTDVCTVQGLAIEKAVGRSHCDAIFLLIARPFTLIQSYRASESGGVHCKQKL
jgi:hypothetical protein